MLASSCSRSASALGLCAAFGLGAPVAASELETPVQLACLLQSGELAPGSTGNAVPAGEPGGFAFEHMASRRRGNENALRLAAGFDESGQLPGVTAGARLRLELELEQLAEGTPGLRDTSSWLEVAWQAGSARIGLRAYPFDTDYVRLGYLHWLDWGGTDASRGESIFVDQEGGVPGTELELQLPRARLFTALKWTRLRPERGEERRWGVLFGGSFEPSPALGLDFGFGYFERGQSAPAVPAGFVEGASLRVRYGQTEPALSVEPFNALSLRDEPEQLRRASSEGVALALEGVALVQRVRRGDGSESFRLEPAPGAAVYGSMLGGWGGLHAVLAWRSLPLVLRSAHGLISGEALPSDARVLDELAAWGGASATWAGLGLTPSIELGCLLPAQLQLKSALPGVAQSFVVRGAAQAAALPLGASRLPVFSSRVGVRWQASGSLALALFASYERDANRAGLRSSPRGPVRAFVSPDSLTMTAATWARF